MIREAEQKDFEQIEKLCEKHKLNMPNYGTILVNVNKNDEIKAMVLIRPVLQINSFISEHPNYSIDLFCEMEKRIVKDGVPLAQTYIEKKNKRLLEKIGFQRQFKNCIIMEKIYR